MRKMGGLFKKIPFTATIMWIGSLAIIGFPYFSGYYSKESILENAYFSSSSMSQYAYIVGVLTALLTAFYSWRLLFLTFHGETRASKEIYDYVHESPKVMTTPLLILAIGSIFSGMILSDYFIGDKQNVFWNHVIILTQDTQHYMPFLQTLIIKSSVAIGVLFAAYVYFYRVGTSKKISYNLDPLYSISLNKWYVDELYNNIFVKPFFYLASFFWKKGDIGVIDSYGPNGVSRLISFFSRNLSLFQSGYLYHYAFAMLGGLVIILTWFIYY
jgi:NADH-quinone oxidoreductase subunit L